MCRPTIAAARGLRTGVRSAVTRGRGGSLASRRANLPGCRSEAHGDRMLARLAEPRRRPVGLPARGGRSLLLDCGPGVLSRLARRASGQSPDAIAITHFHLDHWGDLVPWVWGWFHSTGLGRRPGHPELWVPPGGRRASRSSARSSASRTCSSASSRSSSTRPASRSRPAATRSRRAGCRTTRSSRSAFASPRTGARSPTRRLGPRRAPQRACPGGRPLHLRGDAVGRRQGRPAPRPPLARRGRGGVRGLRGAEAADHTPAGGARHAREVRAGLGRPRGRDPVAAS